MECPACEGERLAPALNSDGFSWLRCESCRSMRVEEPPGAHRLAALYSGGDYFTNEDFGPGGDERYRGYLEYLADRRPIETKFAEVLAHVEAWTPPGRLLDVGSGPGLMLSAARTRGWSAVGLDPNPWAARYGREELGVEIHQTTLAEAALPAASFDAVVLMDVIEHVTDPGQLIEQATRAARAGAALAILTPDAGSLVSRALGRRWPEALRAPEHLVLFSVTGLAALLERYGWHIYGWHPIGKTSSLSTLVADVSPVAPRALGAVRAMLGTSRLGRLQFEFDPRTKFCIYAQRRRTRSTDPGKRRAAGRPPRLPKRAPPQIPKEAVLGDLLALTEARRLNRWMFDQFRDAVVGEVAEVGAGVGTFTQLLLDAGARNVLAIEPEARSAQLLQSRFAGVDRVAVSRASVPGASVLTRGRGAFHLVLCQNVLEHVDDDAGAVREMAAALRPGGELALLAPADPRLYGSLDLAYGHRRRYTPDALRALVADAGLTLVRLRWFNLLGVAGWWLSNRLGRARIGKRSLYAYETLVPAARRLEERLRPPMGLSLVVRARRLPH